MAQIKREGGWVAYDWQTIPLTGEVPGPAWLRAAVGDDFFQNVETVTFWDTPVSDLAVFADLPRLKSLAIPRADVRDLMPLARLRELEWLCLSNVPVSDVSALERLVKLKVLYLDGTRVTNLHPLHRASNLQELWVENTGISEEELLRFHEHVPQCRLVK